MSLTCARARASILDQELGRLAPDRAAELAHHLAQCPACHDRVAEEARLSARIGALAALDPPVLDVRARVLREIATRNPARELSPVGWAATAAAAAAAALLGWSVLAWPDLLAGVRQARAAVEGLAVAAWAVVSALAPVGAWLLDLVGSAARTLGSLAPLAREMLVAGAVAAMITIACAVTRDLVRPSLAPVEDR